MWTSSLLVGILCLVKEDLFFRTSGFYSDVSVDGILSCCTMFMHVFACLSLLEIFLEAATDYTSICVRNCSVNSVQLMCSPPPQIECAFTCSRYGNTESTCFVVHTK
jgi:hypothetical protein